MEFSKNDTALVVIDPQNDVLSEKGVSWGLVGASVRENGTVENLERLFEGAKAQGYGVFISPQYHRKEHVTFLENAHARVTRHA